MTNLMLGFAIAFFGSFCFANAVAHRWLKVEATGMELLGYLLLLFIGYMMMENFHYSLSFRPMLHVPGEPYKEYQQINPFLLSGVSLLGGYVFATLVARFIGKIKAGWRQLLGFTALFLLIFIPLCLAISVLLVSHQGFGR